MTAEKPVVYIFHGEDEFSIAQEVSKLKSKLDGPAVADMSTTQMDGRAFNLAELRMTCLAAPFMAHRRLVILTHPLAGLSTPSARETFVSLLEQIPASTALVLVENRSLTADKDRQKGKIHWLERWATSAGPRAYLRQFKTPEGEFMSDWIHTRARDLGGQFTPKAAELLSTLVSGDTLLADQEIRKLLFYANFSRPVEEEDVVRLTPFEGKLEDFALVNALRGKDAQKALHVVRKQLEEEDPLRILGSIVYQFRLLLLLRALLDQGGTITDVVEKLTSKLGSRHRWPAYYAAKHALNFDTPTLESIYHRLLETDTAIKCGQMPADLALETLVIQLSV